MKGPFRSEETSYALQVVPGIPVSHFLRCFATHFCDVFFKLVYQNSPPSKALQLLRIPCCTASSALQKCTPHSSVGQTQTLPLNFVYSLGEL
jgi:hypothetical protein